MSAVAVATSTSLPSVRAVRAAESALQILIGLMQRWAMRQQSVLTQVLGIGTVPPAWAHFPDDDAHDPQSGFRWYYHCHPGGGHTRGEHGHFHLFADTAQRQSDAAEVAHLVAVSVDARGMPLGLFAPNRWVTDEQWQPARTTRRLLRGFVMRTPARWAPVHEWLRLLLMAFSPQVAHLLDQRDARLARIAPRRRQAFFEDRRVAVMARFPIDITAQARLIDGWRAQHRSRMKQRGQRQ